MIVIAVLASAALPALTQQFMNMAEQKTAMDINNIENAALAYYVKNNVWPTSITPVTGFSTDLESNGYLPSGWNATNPFGNVYSISSTVSLLTVSTQVVSNTQSSIAYQLPTSSYSGNVVSSSVPIPGVSSHGYGPLVQQNIGQTYTATSDGNIQSFNRVSNNNDVIYGFVNGTQVCGGGTASGANGTGPEGTGAEYPCNFTVAKGDSYIVETPGFGTAVMYFRSS